MEKRTKRATKPKKITIPNTVEELLSRDDVYALVDDFKKQLPELSGAIILYKKTNGEYGYQCAGLKHIEAMGLTGFLTASIGKEMTEDDDDN